MFVVNTFESSIAEVNVSATIAKTKVAKAYKALSNVFFYFINKPCLILSSTLFKSSILFLLKPVVYLH